MTIRGFEWVAVIIAVLLIISLILRLVRRARGKGVRRWKLMG